MKKFVQNLSDYNFTGTLKEEESDDDEVELLVESEEPAVLSQSLNEEEMDLPVENEEPPMSLDKDNEIFIVID